MVILSQEPVTLITLKLSHGRVGTTYFGIINSAKDDAPQKDYTLPMIPGDSCSVTELVGEIGLLSLGSLGSGVRDITPHFPNCGVRMCFGSL